MSSEQLTTDERVELQKFLEGYGSTTTQQAHNVHTFLNKVATAPDTTKLGYLKDEELGIPNLPIRTFKELSIFCKEVADMSYFADYFDKQSEVVTSTSLSRDAKLLTLAVIQKRQVEDVTKTSRVENKGWFKKKDKEGGDQQLT